MFERRNQEKCLLLSSQRLINERQVGRIGKKFKVCEARVPVPPPTHRGRSPLTAFSIVFIRILEEERVLVSHILPIVIPQSVFVATTLWNFLIGPSVYACKARDPIQRRFFS